MFNMCEHNSNRKTGLNRSGIVLKSNITFLANKQNCLLSRLSISTCQLVGHFMFGPNPASGGLEVEQWSSGMTLIF